MVTVVELAQAHVNNVAGNLEALRQERANLDARISEVEKFLVEANTQIQQQQEQQVEAAVNDGHEVVISENGKG